MVPQPETTFRHCLMSVAPDPLDRYVRQYRFGPLGKEAQQKLSESRVLLVGCGALGSVLANTLARAGVGFLRVVDRDFLEWNNLQRQVLYDETDVKNHEPKAVAAANRLRQINSQITIEPQVADVHAENILQLADGVDLILDGTDNFETRYLVNDASVKLGVPWVFGGAIGATGQSMTILPKDSACFRCLQPEPPPAAATETCDSAGILATIINVVASIQATEAIKILTGHLEAISRSLAIIDLWENRMRHVSLGSLRDQGDCPCCKHDQFDWLGGKRGNHTAVLCGRNAVQLSNPQQEEVSLTTLAARLDGLGEITQNRYLLRFKVDEYQLTVFPDGRAIIGGTEDIAEAKTLYARYVGS
jgi:molybdopterin/thiamine biosynthesis adenylyltransferase